ncbi:MAG: PIN domain nuclease [Deltaproteobacteria bacterium]|nr:PIN domain nuclease [Deltaproteobacteria bacterium]
MILTDTSVLIDYFRGVKNKGVTKFKKVLEHDIPFGITSFIFQELLQGAKTEKEYRLLKKYLSSQRLFQPKDPVDSSAQAARIYFDCRKRGITIRSSVDCLIAQISIEHNLLLLHNGRDFVLMKELIDLKFY